MVFLKTIFRISPLALHEDQADLTLDRSHAVERLQVEVKKGTRRDHSLMIRRQRRHKYNTAAFERTAQAVARAWEGSSCK